jgi:transposase
MDIIAAYREAGSFRGAAQIAGTTHKTVKRVIARHEAGGGAPQRAPRGHNYDEVAAPSHSPGRPARPYRGI